MADLQVVTRRALVSGRVQGVGYRLTCAQEADRLGLTGHARNLDDGRVEVVVTGPATKVAALLAWCRVGPPGARVQAVTETEAPETTTGTTGARSGRRFEVR